jgi:hypothetical protein
MTSLRLFRPAALTLLLAVAFAAGHAQTAISNFGQGSGGSANLGTDFGGSTARRTFSFTTGANAAGYTFANFTLGIAQAATGSPGSMVVGLYSTFNAASGSSPTGLVSNLTLSSGNPATAGSAVFSATATLAASTTYYVMLAAPTATTTGNYFTYRTAANINEDSGGLAGWMIGDVGYASLNGGAWIDGGGGQYSIGATAIPEPSTYAALAGLGALGLAFWRRRQTARVAG